MAELKVRDKIWDEFSSAAARQRRRPEAVVEQLMKDYLQSMKDEELLRRSRQEARKARFPIDDTEAMIRRIRRTRRKAS